MHSTSLREFVSLARQAGRIRFGDLRRLQRDILPARLTTREDAEALIALDRSVTRADPDWTNYLVGAVRDFVVWGLAPAGTVDREKAGWLVRVLSAGGASKTARVIAREVAQEACEVDEVLLAFAAGGPKRRSREGVECAGGLEPEGAVTSPADGTIPDLDGAPSDSAIDQRHWIFDAHIEEALRGLHGVQGGQHQLAIAADLEGREVPGRYGVNPDHHGNVVTTSSP